MDDSQHATVMYGGNAAFVEALYETYLTDPASVDSDWRSYFDEVRSGAAETAHSAVQQRFYDLGRRRLAAPAPAAVTPRQQRRSAGGGRAHQRLPGLRPHQRRQEPADHPPARRGPGTHARVLRPERSGFADPGAGRPLQRHAGADHRPARPELLRGHRLRVLVPAVESSASGSSSASRRPRAGAATAPSKKSASTPSSTPPRGWRSTCTSATWARSASRWRAARASFR